MICVVVVVLRVVIVSCLFVFVGLLVCWFRLCLRFMCSPHGVCCCCWCCCCFVVAMIVCLVLCVDCLGCLFVYCFVCRVC